MCYISVILPCYNVSKYIAKCLESVLSQTFQDFEIICIDDASTDNTLEILKKYKRNYPKIKLIEKKENEGLAMGRKTGIEYASGKYIAFVDSDDFIAKDYLMNLYNNSDNGKYDCVICSGHYTKFRFFKTKCISTSTNLTLEQIKSTFFTQWHKFASYTWNKLYKRDIVVTMPKINHFFQEDVIFNMYAFEKVKNFKIIDYYGYYYRVCGGSSFVSNQYINDIKTMYRTKLAFLNNNNIIQYDQNVMLELKNCFYDYIIRYILSGLSTDKIIDLINEESNDKIYHELAKLPMKEDVSALLKKDTTEIYKLAKSKITQRRLIGVYVRKLFGY